MDIEDIARALGRIEGSQEAANDKLDGVIKRLDTQNGRIGSLERSRSRFGGFVAAVAGTAGAVVTIIAQKFGFK